MEHRAGEYEIETYTGRFVDTQQPDPSTICVEDIAHALSQTCRYGGHCGKYFSVAEHSVFVSRRLEQKGHSASWQLAGLHHDDAEAYLGDIPRPMKPLLGDAYEGLTVRMDEAIVAALGLPFSATRFHEPAVKLTDSWALFIEARHLLPSGGKSWSSDMYQRRDLAPRMVTPAYWLGGVAASDAEAMFLERHVDLMEAVRGEVA